VERKRCLLIGDFARGLADTIGVLPGRGGGKMPARRRQLAPNDWDSYNKWAVILSTKLPEYAGERPGTVSLYEEAASLYAKAADRPPVQQRSRFRCGANWAGVLVQAAHVSSNREVKVRLLRESLRNLTGRRRCNPTRPALTRCGELR